MKLENVDRSRLCQFLRAIKKSLPTPSPKSSIQLKVLTTCGKQNGKKA